MPPRGRGHQSSTSTLQRSHAHIQFPLVQEQQSKGKGRVTSDASNLLADLLNVQSKDEANDAIGKFFFANTILFHLAHSPYYKEVRR